MCSVPLLRHRLQKGALHGRPVRLPNEEPNALVKGCERRSQCTSVNPTGVRDGSSTHFGTSMAVLGRRELGPEEIHTTCVLGISRHEPKALTIFALGFF